MITDNAQEEFDNNPDFLEEVAKVKEEIAESQLSDGQKMVLAFQLLSELLLSNCETTETFFTELDNVIDELDDAALQGAEEKFGADKVKIFLDAQEDSHSHDH